MRIEKLEEEAKEALKKFTQHPFHDPDSHNFSPEGTKEATLTGFLGEIQEIVEKEKLI